MAGALAPRIDPVTAFGLGVVVVVVVVGGSGGGGGGGDIDG